MKSLFKKSAVILFFLAVIAATVYVRLQPIREYASFPPYTGVNNFAWNYPSYDSAKKTVIIMADNDMTELFDFLAPYYLFNETGKANVYITAQKKYPVLTENGPFILPHFTYSEIDSLKISPDVIVIPYMHSPESPAKAAWLQKHYNDSVIILSVCDGAWTAAASGLYDGKPLTSHATGHEKIKEKYPRPLWVQNTSVTESGNLFSTGGVSNAADGSLTVIEKLFGHETMLSVLEKVNYPHADIHKSHISNSLNTSAIISGLNKVLFRQNKTVGVLMQNNVSEMELGAVFDIYARTLPSSIVGVMPESNTITTRHGLTVLSTDKIIPDEIDELHILIPGEVSEKQLEPFKNAQVISYETQNRNYIIDVCLDEIKEEYGYSFQKFVKLTLDYN